MVLTYLAPGYGSTNIAARQAKASLMWDEGRGLPVTAVLEEGPALEETEKGNPAVLFKTSLSESSLRLPGARGSPAESNR